MVSVFQKPCLVGSWILVSVCCCRSAPYNRIEVIDYRSNQPAQLHFEDFDEAYYGVGEGGLVEVVLRKQTRWKADQTRRNVQVIVLRTFWKPIPGRTYAEDSGLNANLRYMITRGGSAISYEGGGFFYYAEDAEARVITGRLEGGDLQPLRALGGDIGIFDKARISGRFKARRDDRRVAKIINRMEAALGPPPRIEPAHRGPDY